MNDIRQSIGPATGNRRRWIAGMLMFVHTILLGWGAYRHSPSYDEVGHLVAGVSHWQFGRHDLYRVNPPLVRMVGSLPVVLSQPSTNWDAWRESPTSRSEFSLGAAFITANGERSFWYFTLARWACLPFSWIGAWVCWRWAGELYGPRSGVWALALWCFCPNIIAHAQMITPDVAAASLGAAAVYLFWHWLRRPDWASAYAAGVALGMAELAKASWIILFGLLPLAGLVWLVSGRELRSRHVVVRRGIHLLSIATLAVGMINLGYGFDGSFERLGDFKFISRSLSGVTEPHRETREGNRFRDSLLAKIPVPLPRQYVLGIDLQKWDFEQNKPSYLRGEVRRGGWWYYYIYGLMVKVPLGTWVLAALATLAAIFGGSGQATRRDQFLVWLPIIVVLAFVSSQTGINKHVRYVLPIFPFAFVWISQVANLIDRKPNGLLAMTASVGLVWSVASSLFVYPHSLAYFNELAGGPRQGSFHLLSSNIAWGQDVLYLKRWLESQPEPRPLYLAMHCGFDPRDAGIEFSLPPQLRTDENVGDGSPTMASQLPAGWYVIDANVLRGYPYSIPNGQGGRVSSSNYSFEKFRDLEPIARIGYSLWIYQSD